MNAPLTITSEDFARADREASRKLFLSRKRALQDAKDVFEEECRERCGEGGAHEAGDETFDLELLANDIARDVERWVAKANGLSIGRVAKLDAAEAVQLIHECIFDQALGSGASRVLAAALCIEVDARVSIGGMQ